MKHRRSQDSDEVITNKQAISISFLIMGFIVALRYYFMMH